MKIRNKDKVKIALLIMLVLGIIFFFGLKQVNADLGNFRQNTCVSIRVLANCSTINLTEVSNKNVTYTINSKMTNLGGQTFNYSFCNTSYLDTYTYSWNNPCIDCSQSPCGNSFSITTSGYQVDTSKSIIIFSGLGILIIISLVLFYFGFNLENIIVKIFTIGLSSLLLIFSIGYVLTVINTAMAEFSNITGIINVIYIIGVALITVGGMGIIVWLIAFVMTMFSRYRGLKD